MKSVAFLGVMIMCVAPTASADFFDSNGVPIHYVDNGDGEPVILIHGLNSDLQSWIDNGVMPALLDSGFRVLAIDTRAHGLSGTPHDPMQYGPEMALDIQRLMAHLEIDKAHIVGYSMGSNIVGKLRELSPELCITLTLGGLGWWREVGPNADQLALADSLESGSGFMPLYRVLYPTWTEEARLARSEEMISNLPDVQATVALLRGYRLGVSERSLRANTVPTLAIIGDLDPGKNTVDALEGVMPNLEIVVIPNADHLAALARPEFTDSLLTFLKRHRTN